MHIGTCCMGIRNKEVVAKNTVVANLYHCFHLTFHVAIYFNKISYLITDYDMNLIDND